MVVCLYVIILILKGVTVNSQSPAILSVTNVIPGATATFECSLPSLTIPTSLNIYKDIALLYQCTNIAFTCIKTSPENDYSDVTFTDLGTASAKGTFTVANADQTRDGGEWTCKYGTSRTSSSVSFVVSATTTASTTVSDDCSWCLFPHNGSCWPCIIVIIVGIIIGIVVVVCCSCGICNCCCRPNTAHHIRDMIVEKVTPDTMQLLWRMKGLHPKKLDLKAICGDQHHTVSPKDDETYTVTFHALAPDTSITISLEFTDEDGAHCMETVKPLQTMKDHIRDMIVDNVTTDSIQLRWRMEGLHSKTPGLKAICEKQHLKVGHENDGTHTVTVEDLAPDTSITIYLEFTDKDLGHCKEILIQKQIMKDHIRDMTVEKVTDDTIQLRWSMDGLHPKILGLKAIWGKQHDNVYPKDDGTYTVTFHDVAPATSITIYLEFTDEDGAHCKETVKPIQTMKDHIRDMTVENVTNDTIQLKWSMNGLHPKKLGLKAICGDQHNMVDPDDDGMYTVTFHHLAPDTSITIYLEFTRKDGAHCKKTVKPIQAMKDKMSSTAKPKGLHPLKTNQVHPTDTPSHGHDGEKIHKMNQEPSTN